MSYLNELATKRIAVVGAGVTGSAVLDFLITRGISADLFDEKYPGAKRSVESSYDLAIVSPGWRRDNKILIELTSGGCSLLSEIDFAWLVKEEVGEGDLDGLGRLGLEAQFEYNQLAGDDHAVLLDILGQRIQV